MSVVWPDSTTEVNSADHNSPSLINSLLILLLIIILIGSYLPFLPYRLTPALPTLEQGIKIKSRIKIKKSHGSGDAF